METASGIDPVPVTCTRFCWEQVRFSYIDTGLNGLAFVRLYRTEGEAGPGPAQLAEAVVRRTMETKRCKTRLATPGSGVNCSLDGMGGGGGWEGGRMAFGQELCRLMQS